MRRRGKFKPDRPLSAGKKWIIALAALAVAALGMASITSITKLNVSAVSTGTGQGTKASTTTQTGRPQVSLSIERHYIGVDEQRPKSGSLTEYWIDATIVKPSTGEIIINDKQKNPKDLLNPRFLGLGNMIWSDPDNHDNQVFSMSEVATGNSSVYRVRARFQEEWLTDTSLPDSTQVKAQYTIRTPDGMISDENVVVRKTDGTPLTLGDVRSALKAGQKVEAASTGAEGDIITTAPQKESNIRKTPEDNPAARCQNTKGVIQSSLCELLVGVGEWFERQVEGAGNIILNLIKNYSASTTAKLETWVEGGWSMARSLVNIIAVIALIIIAFANILHINLNVYAVKRMLPLLIGAVIGANLSLFAIKALTGLSINLTDSLTGPAAQGISALADRITELFTSIMLGLFGWGDGLGLLGGMAAVSGASAGLTLIGLVVLILLILAGIALLIIGFLIIIQPGVVGILTIFAPIAIVLMALPFGQGIFKKWLTYTFNWIFMLPVMMLLFSLMSLMAPAVAILGTPGATMAALFAVAGQVLIMVFAIRMPFTMGGDIAKGWGAAGAFVTKQAGSYTYGGALGAQAYRGQIRKQMEESGIDLKNRTQVNDYLKKNLGKRGRLRYWAADKGIAKAVTWVHPQGISSGIKRMDERRQAMIQGLQPPYGGAYGALTGRGELFASDRDSQAGKAQLLSPQKLLEKFLTLQGKGKNKKSDFKMTPQQKLSAIKESPGAFEGHLASGALWGNVPTGDAPEAWAIIREMFRRSSMSQYGELAFPAITKTMIQEGLTDSLNDFSLAVASLDKDVLSPDALNAEIEKRYGPEDAENAKKRIKDMADRIEERRRKKGISDNGTEAVGSGPEEMLKTGEITENDLALPKDVNEEFAQSVRETSRSISKTANETGGLLAKATEGPVPVIISEPVAIDDSNGLSVVDNTVLSALNKTTSDTQNALKRAGADPATQSRLFNAMDTVKIAPEDVNQILDAQGVRTPDGKIVKLTSPTELLMRRFVTTATTGRAVTEATARNFYQQNLSDLMPYFGQVSEEVGRGRLKPSDLGTIERDISQKLSVIRGGGTLSPEQLNELRDNMARVSPGVSITPQTSVTDLMRTGGTVVSALEKMRNPAVTRVLEQKGNPQQVQEVIVKQAAQGLVRDTSVERISSIAQQASRPAELRVHEVARQIGSFANSSGAAAQWGGLSPIAKQQIATDVARRMIGKTDINEGLVQQELQAKLGTVRSTRPAPPAGGRPVAPTAPAMNVPGAAAPETPPTPGPTPPTPPPAAPPR